MPIPSFDQRISQSKILGIPNTTALFLLGSVTFICVGIVVPATVLKAAFVFLGVAMLYLARDDFKRRSDWLVQIALYHGNEMKKRPTFSSHSDKLYSREHCWYTRVGEYGIAHKDNVVSVAFTWSGSFNRYKDEDDFSREINKRVSLLKRYNQFKKRLCIEHHFIRVKDSKKADDYLAYQKSINPNAPPIVQQVIADHAELCRQKARSNKLLTVISVKADSYSTFASIFGATKGTASQWKKLEQECLSVFSAVKSEYADADLLTCEEFIDSIFNIRVPDSVANSANVDWRYALSDQIITSKPSVQEDCLLLDGWYYKICLLQNYPDMPLNWFLGICEAPINVHISQIVLPQDSDAALDKSAAADRHEKAAAADNRGVDQLVTKMQNAAGFRRYVSNRNLPVAENAYIVTFISKEKEQVNHFAERLSQSIIPNGGMIRSDIDLQLSMFQFRLPGQGIATPFKRLDHGELIAAMMPFTTFNSGSQIPEVLRVSTSGQLVTFAPSSLNVSHELASGETGGGKDTQYGMKILESYRTVRYDIIELGNSYQGLIESVEGRYCRAKEQIINPLAQYRECASAQELERRGEPNLYANFLEAQANILLPIFHGFNVVEYSRPEQVVIGRILVHLYENPIAGKDAPILPDLLAAFDHIKTSSEAQEAALKTLRGNLFEFLETPTGSCFKSADQYVISPIANAIDFLGLEGNMFKYFLNFVCTRLAQNAMSSGTRNQIILNEYKVLYDLAPDVIRQITVTIDRMGRKDWVGLTRISQGIEEIEAVDAGAINSIGNKTLLSRKDKHREIGRLLKVPPAAIAEWELFHSPEDRKPFREAFVLEHGQWHKLFLQFPKLLLDLMNTDGDTKEIRNKVYRETKDPFERIRLYNQYLDEQRTQKDKKGKPNEKPTSTNRSRTSTQPLL